MPIEFHCPDCDKLLRVQDDAAGKQAKCPSCSAVLTVPEATKPSGESNPFAPLPSESTGTPDDNPFGMAPPVDRPGDINPYASPASTAGGMDSIPDGTQSAIVPTIIDIGDVMSRAWEIFKLNVWMCALVVFVCWIIPTVTSYAVAIPIAVAQAAGMPAELIFMFQVVSQLLLMAFQIWIGIGQTMYFIQTGRGNDPSFAIIFQGTPFLLRMIGFTFLMILLVLGILAVGCGGPFLITWAATGDPEVGGIAALIAALPATILLAYVSLMFAQAGNLIIDQGLGVFESMGVSRTVMSGNKLMVFVLGLVAIPIILVGVLAFCVGYFFAMAYVMLMTATAYLVMTGQNTASRPAVPPMPAA